MFAAQTYNNYNKTSGCIKCSTKYFCVTGQKYGERGEESEICQKIQWKGERESENQETCRKKTKRQRKWERKREIIRAGKDGKKGERKRQTVKSLSKRARDANNWYFIRVTALLGLRKHLHMHDWLLWLALEVSETTATQQGFTCTTHDDRKTWHITVVHLVL